MSRDFDGYESRLSTPQQQSGNRLLLIMIGLSGLFLLLKLTHVTEWSYWWVFAPIWIPFALAFLIALGKAADK